MHSAWNVGLIQMCRNVQQAGRCLSRTGLQPKRMCIPMERKNWFSFKPRKELLVVLASYILVVATFYLAFNIFTTRLVALNFITFGVIGVLGFGIIAPVAWFLLVWKRPLRELGITRQRLAASMVLGLALTLVQYFITLRTIQLPPPVELVPLLTMAITVGLFENIFYRGWMQLRMEESFGIVPAVLLSSILYSLYHIGYGMRPDELLVLFFVGLVYAIIFRLTSNIFILFPFLTPTGAIFSQIKEGLTLPFAATLGFVDVLAAAFIAIWLIARLQKKRQEAGRPTISQTSASAR